MRKPTETAIAAGINPDPPIAARFQWRHQYDDARDALERELSNPPHDPVSMTRQEFADDANLNIVLRRFGVTDGAIPPAMMETLTELDPKYYGDFTDVADLKTQLERIRTAWEHFDALPAELRSRFDNDPIKLYEWVNDPANKEEAIELHILRADPIERPVPKTATERAHAQLAKVQKELADAKAAAAAPAVQTTPAPIPTPTKTP